MRSARFAHLKLLETNPLARTPARPRSSKLIEARHQLKHVTIRQRASSLAISLAQRRLRATATAVNDERPCLTLMWDLLTNSARKVAGRGGNPVPLDGCCSVPKLFKTPPLRIIQMEAPVAPADRAPQLDRRSACFSNHFGPGPLI